MATRLKTPIRHFGKPVKNADGSTRYEPTEVDQEFTCVSIEGQSFKCEKDGTFLVPDALVQRLVYEGWRVVKKEDEPDADKKDGGKKAA